LLAALRLRLALPPTQLSNPFSPPPPLANRAQRNNLFRMIQKVSPSSGKFFSCKRSPNFFFPRLSLFPFRDTYHFITKSFSFSVAMFGVLHLKTLYLLPPKRRTFSPSLDMQSLPPLQKVKLESLLDHVFSPSQRPSTVDPTFFPAFLFLRPGAVAGDLSHDCPSSSVVVPALAGPIPSPTAFFGVFIAESEPFFPAHLPQEIRFLCPPPCRKPRLLYSPFFKM